MARLSLGPGFRFHPTDVELVVYYLKRKLLRKKIISNVVAEVNIYDFFPWDLPDKSSLKSGDLKWYFFCPKSKKYSSGGRAKRSTENGYWKATGKDRKVTHNGRIVATIQTLIFYRGRAVDGQRTNWVMHEYRMDDEKLATEGIVQDAYVLCKIYEKSGSGPKNSAQYGAPFNEEEWEDDLVSSLDSQVIIGPVGASSSVDHEQKGPATTNLTELGSSVVIFSANEAGGALNNKQKGPATTNMTEPGSSIVMNGPPITLSYKQKGPATTNMTEPGSSSMVTDEPINALNYTQKGPATVNMTVPQITHGLCVTEPGSTSVAMSTDEIPANDDVIFVEDLDMIMGPSEGAPNEDDGIFNYLENILTPNKDDGIFGDLENIIDLDYCNDIKTDDAGYTLDELPRPDDLSLWTFYVD